MYWDGHGWAAPLQAPVATKKSSSGGKVALVVVGIFVVLFAIGKCGSGDTKTSSSSSSSSNTSSRITVSSAAPAEPTAAPAGSSVRDGKFEFRALSMTRAQQAGDLSNQFEVVDAQGEFIILTMSVTNIGDQAQSYFGANQKLIDTSGREYDANNTADMWANKGTGDINPGNSIQVKAAFDVPPGTQPAELEVHDSMFSGGAKVRL
ncbi:MAG: hypothetical protein V7643_3659 [Mycobacterium sp.]|jgi:hypothetical protein